MGPSRRALQVFLAALGAVAVVAGLVGVFTGPSLIRGAGAISPSVDSELRFFAAWYVGAGGLLLWTVPRVEREGGLIRGLCAAVLLAALGRVVSLVVAGRPHPLYLVLMAIEFAIPIVVVPWQAAVARRAGEVSARG